MANTEYGPGIVPTMPNPYAPGGALYQSAAPISSSGLSGTPSSGAGLSNLASAASAANPGAANPGAAAAAGVGDIISAGLGFLNAHLDRKQERELAEQQRDWNEHMMDKQNQWSLNMWNKTNEYNSPTEQIARLREAGLNPLYYGLDGTSANALESAQALGYDRASMRGLANPVQGALDSLVKFAQEKLTLANVRKAETDADLSAEKAITESLLRDRHYDLLGVEIDLTGANADLSRKNIDKIGSEISEIEKNIEKMDYEIDESLNRIDVSQRGQLLQEIAFQFNKWLDQQKYNQAERQIAVDWFNAQTSRIVGRSNVELNDKQKVYLDRQGAHINALTQTENALRPAKAEAAKWQGKQAEREYRWMPVEKTVGVVRDAAATYANIAMPITAAGYKNDRAIEGSKTKVTQSYEKAGGMHESRSWYE